MNTQSIESILMDILSQNPKGISEFDLIRKLQKSTHLPNLSLSEHLPLFRIHFLLFHALYKLRERLWIEQSGHLEVNPISILLCPYDPGSSALCKHDPLKDYYLDITHLEDTTEEEVAEMLGKFWTKYYAGEKRLTALAMLELEKPENYAAIKRQYRRLAFRHHPDRGGDQLRLQQINEAMDVLKKYHEN